MPRQIWIVCMLVVVLVSVQACGGGSTPPETPTPPEPPTSVPEATAPSAPTEPPTQPPQPEMPTEEPRPTATLAVPVTSTVELTATGQLEPTSPPVSTGPLDFAEPTRLDYWRVIDEQNGDYEATIILHITGGAPPYTVYQDATLMVTTWESDPQLVFVARGCGALVHTITIESADGQRVAHDYWIPVPWC